MRDPKKQAEILERIEERGGLGEGVAAEIADKIAVMYAGRIVETADVDAIFEQTSHPYTLGLLNSNPHHMIGRWATVTAALEEEDFLHFLRHLERRYPCEQAERMLATLGFELTNERDAYYSDEEYAASLLSISTERLTELFGNER